jgi:uncharacterized membrane protein
LGEREENRLGENISARLFPLISPFLRGGLRAIQPIQGQDVAKGDGCYCSTRCNLTIILIFIIMMK